LRFSLSGMTITFVSMAPFNSLFEILPMLVLLVPSFLIIQTFQFSFWDSCPEAASGRWSPESFQFSFWDSTWSASPLQATWSTSFNSLFEIRQLIASGAYRICRITFQFSFWDSEGGHLSSWFKFKYYFQFSFWDSTTNN